MAKLKKPLVFVAPNGARKGKADHHALPITVPEIVDTAKICFAAGADGLHAHVRDPDGRHVLDGGLYGELLKELKMQVPDMAVQITTEAVGLYSPQAQRDLVMQVQPKMVSVALAEMMLDTDLAAVSRFYYAAQEQDIDVQHIVYSPDEFSKLAKMIMLGTIPARQKSVLFVLGRYAQNQQSDATMLRPFLDRLGQMRQAENWRFMTCAFGQGETDCLIASARAGGDCRVGFENNFLQADGSIASDNGARVTALIDALRREGFY